MFTIGLLSVSSVMEGILSCNEWNDVLFFLCSVLCFKTTDSLISANAKVCTSL